MNRGLASQCILFLFSIVLLSQAQAQDQTDKPKDKVIILLHWLGVEAHYGLQIEPLFPQTETILWLGGIGAYKFHNLYRDPNTNETIQSANPTTLTAIYRIQATVRLGIAQGLLYNEPLKKNFLEFFLYYFFQSDQFLSQSNSYLANSSLSDRSGLFSNTLLTGFALDNAQYGLPHGLRQGYYLETSFETAPQALQSATQGPIDYSRFNLLGKLYFPLFDLNPQNPMNTFSALLAIYGSLDSIQGDHPSLLALQTFGGRDVRSGLGGSVRGVDSGRFDSTLKTVFNADLRVNGPSIIWPELIPGLVGYLDWGLYGDLPGLKSGSIFSGGYGLYIDLFTLAHIVFYQDFWFNGTVLVAEKFPGVRIGFGIHY